MTTHVEDVTTGVGLVIDGDVEAGGDGHLSGDQPGADRRGGARGPGDVADQLDRAVAAARRAQPAWAAWPMEERAALVIAAAEAGVAAVEAGDLARC